MARGKPHSPETKEAVKAALLTGQSPADVARQFGLDKSVVSRWKDQIAAPGLQLVATEKADTLEALLRGYVVANLKALTAQAGVASDDAYLRRFPPQQLAVLHGVMADKAARIIEFAAGAGRREAGGEGGGEEEGGPQAAAGKIVIEYFDDTASTSAHGAGADQG